MSQTARSSQKRRIADFPPGNLRPRAKAHTEKPKKTGRSAKKMKYHSPGVVYVTADNGTVYDSATLSKVANACLAIKGIKASFVMGRVGDGVKMSCRSDGSISVQLIAEKLGGGGHLHMSAVAFPGVRNAKEVEEKLINVFYTDSYSSWQKGGIERNHEFIR